MGINTSVFVFSILIIFSAAASIFLFFRRKYKNNLQNFENQYNFFKSITEQIPGIVYSLDGKINVIYINDHCKEIFGYSPEELKKDSNLWWQMILPEDLPIIKSALADNKTDFCTEYRIKREDNTIIWIRDEGKVSYNKNGSIKRIDGTSRDITELKKRADYIEENEERLKYALEASENALWDWNLKTGESYISPRFYEIFGFTEKEFIPSFDNFLELIHTDFKDKIISIKNSVFNKETEHFSTEIQMRSKSAWKWITLKGNAVYDKDRKNVDRIIGTISDITDAKETSKLLKENEEKYKQLANAPFEGILIHDEGKILEVNQEICRMSGYNSNELVGKSIIDLVDKKYHEKVILNITFRNLDPYEILLKKKDGSLLEVEILSKPFIYKNRNVQAAAVRDITERKKAEKAIQESEAKYRLLAENMSDVVWTVDLNGNFTYVSPSIEQLRGYTPEEAMQESLKDALTEDSYEAVKKRFIKWQKDFSNGSAKNKPFLAQYRQPCKDGSTIWTEAITNTLFDDKGNPIGIIGVSRDIGDRKKAEEEREKSLSILKAAIESTADGILILDNNNDIIVFNENFTELFSLDENWHEISDVDKRINAAIIDFIDKEKYFDFVHKASKDKTKIFNDVFSLKDGRYIEVYTNPYKIGEEIVGRVWNFRNITEKKKAEEEIEKQKARLEAIFTNAFLGVCMLNPKGEFIYYNDEWAKMLGYKPDELIGLTYNDITYPEDLKDSMENVKKLVLGLTNQIRMEKRYLRKDKTYFWGDISVAAIRNKSGEMEAFIGMIMDITERKRTQIELRKAKERAEEANIEKSRFLANMSHEIRTPLNGIIGMLNLLEKTRLDKNQSDYLGMIKVSYNALLGIINDILDLSKIEAGRVELENAVFDLKELFENIAGVFKYKAEDKNVKFDMIIDRELHNEYIGDPLRLTQIINNLLSNAVKFTEAGFIKAEIKKIDTKGPKDKVEITVLDSGIGIPEDKKMKIFDSFSQADSSTTRKYGGTGLGLAISRNLIEMMNGKIILKSTLGKGSEFSFTVELERNKVRLAEETETETETVKDEDLNKPLKILVAEDNKINQRYVSAFLKHLGHMSDIAENGIEVLEKFKKEHYDCILMDIQMPEMDGTEAARRIREEEKKTGEHIPIIALTASALKGDRERFLKAGMDDYITKPVNEKTLVKALSIVNQKDNNMSKNNETYDEKEKKSSSIRKEELLNLVEYMEIDDFNDLIFDFEKLSAESLNNIEAAEKVKDYDSLNFHAHRLKGMCNNLYGLRAADLSSQLEEMGKNHHLVHFDTILTDVKKELVSMISELKTLIR